MRKKYLLYVSVSLLIILLSALTVTVAFASDDDILTPETVTENYIQFTNPSLMAKSDTLMAVLDSGVIRVFDNNNAELGQIKSSANDIVIINDSIYIAINFKLYRYTITDSGISQTTIPTKEISKLFADNTYIYYVDEDNDVYRYDGASPTKIDVHKLTFISNCSLAAEGDLIYSYNNKGEMSIVGAYSNDWVTIATGEPDISKFYVYSGIPITLSKDKKTIAMGLNSQNTQNITSNTPLDLYVFGDSIFVLDNADKSITEYDKDLNKVSKIGSMGSEPNRLNSPSAIASGDSKLFIADNGNSRITIYDTASDTYSNVAISHTADKIVATANGFATYSRANNKIYIYTLNRISYDPTQEIDTDSDLYDIAAWNNAILGLKGDGNVFNYSSPADITLSHGATNLYINHKTNVLYIAAPTRLTRINLLTGAEQTYNHNEAFSDFAVDYGGNIYFVSYGKIRRFTPNGGALQLTNEYTLTGISSDFSVTLASIGDMYFADKRAHKIAKLSADNLGAVSDKTYTPPSVSEYNVVKGISLEVGAGLYTTPGNEETLITLSRPTRFLALANVTHEGSDYYYGFNYSNSEYYYILKSSVSLLDCTEYDKNHPKYNSLIATGVNIYAFPYDSSAVIEKVDFATRLTLINNVANVAGDSWGWYKVSYIVGNDTKIGYVRDNEIAKVTAVEPPQKSQFYKVNSGALGTVVKMYTESNATSTQICDINDGASVLVVGSFDKNQEYTYIYYNGSYGYIETQYLIAEGLTTVQITATIVVSICVVALLVTVPLFIMLYKRSKRTSSDDTSIQ